MQSRFRQAVSPMTAARLRGRERRRSAPNRYEICCVCYALHVTACDQKVVGTGGDGINAVALQQPVVRREVEVLQRITHAVPTLLHCTVSLAQPATRTYHSSITHGFQTMTTPQFGGLQAEQEWRSTSSAGSICTDVSQKETKETAAGKAVFLLQLSSPRHCDRHLNALIDTRRRLWRQMGQILSTLDFVRRTG